MRVYVCMYVLSRHIYIYIYISNKSHDDSHCHAANRTVTDAIVTINLASKQRFLCNHNYYDLFARYFFASYLRIVFIYLCDPLFPACEKRRIRENFSICAENLHWIYQFEDNSRFNFFPILHFVILFYRSRFAQFLLLYPVSPVIA